MLEALAAQLPRDLEEAALLEGASHWHIFWRIALPLSVTPLATIATLTAINMWNEFFWPYLVARGDEHPVLLPLRPPITTRVLHVINGEHYSGAERVQDLLAMQLANEGFGVDFAALASSSVLIAAPPSSAPRPRPPSGARGSRRRRRGRGR